MDVVFLLFYHFFLLIFTCCIGFYHTTMQISHDYIYAPPLEPPSRPPSHPSMYRFKVIHHQKLYRSKTLSIKSIEDKLEKYLHISNKMLTFII